MTTSDSEGHFDPQVPSEPTVGGVKYCDGQSMQLDGFVHIQARAALDQNIHRLHPFRDDLRCRPEEHLVMESEVRARGGSSRVPEAPASD
jgi:hypothetical protein